MTSLATHQHSQEQTSDALRVEQIKPRHDWILVEPYAPETRTAGGLVIPDTAQKRQWRGTVLAAGPGRWYIPKGCDDVQFVPTQAKVGEDVLFQKSHAIIVTCNRREYWLLPDADIQAIVES